MIARGDEHRRGDAAQAADEVLPGLAVGVVAVEQVAAEQHEVYLLAHGQLRQGGEQLALLLAADGRLARGQRLEGRIQVQIRRVKDLQVSHLSLTASAARHLPVSGSMVNRQPSSFAGPPAAS